MKVSLLCLSDMRKNRLSGYNWQKLQFDATTAILPDNDALYNKVHGHGEGREHAHGRNWWSWKLEINVFNYYNAMGYHKIHNCSYYHHKCIYVLQTICYRYVTCFRIILYRYMYYNQCIPIFLPLVILNIHVC